MLKSCFSYSFSRTNYLNYFDSYLCKALKKAPREYNFIDKT